MLIKDYGLGVETNGWALVGAHGISSDGRTIVGTGYNSGHLEGWIAYLGLDGDFNGDYRVDGADYVRWRHGKGAVFSQADYATWRANYGAKSGQGAGAMAESASSAEVPEPSELLVIAIGIVGFANKTVRKRTG